MTPQEAAEKLGFRVKRIPTRVRNKTSGGYFYPHLIANFVVHSSEIINLLSGFKLQEEDSWIEFHYPWTTVANILKSGRAKNLQKQR